MGGFSREEVVALYRRGGGGRGLIRDGEGAN